MTIERKVIESAAGAAGGNYFGDSSDGAVTTSGDLTYTVLNKNGSYDGDMVVKNYTDFTISSGDTVTVDQPCRGLLIYCSGDLTIAGDLSMTAKGPSADPTASGGSDSSAVNASGIRLAMFTASGTDTLAAADFAGCGNAAVAAVANQPAVAGDGTIFSIGRQGAAGGGGGSCNCTGSAGGGGTNGTTAAAAITNGGGGGGEGTSDGAGTGTGGSGSYGGPWGGGSGGGGAFRTTGANGAAWGGGGGSGETSNVNNGCGNGGSGNPGGPGKGYCPGQVGGTGVGGSIWLVVKGDIEVATTGRINFAGVAASATGGGRRAGGGGSGGGTLMILHGGTLTYTGSGTYNGAGGAAGAGWGATGGAGGNGGYYPLQVTVG